MSYKTLFLAVAVACWTPACGGETSTADSSPDASPSQADAGATGDVSGTSDATDEPDVVSGADTAGAGTPDATPDSVSAEDVPAAADAASTPDGLGGQDAGSVPDTSPADVSQPVDCTKKNLVAQVTGSSDYQAYLMVSASNSRHSARDSNGVLHVAYLDPDGHIATAAQQSDGQFSPSVVVEAQNASTDYRSPTLKAAGDALHVGWLETTSTTCVMHYAVRMDGSDSWDHSAFAAVELDNSDNLDLRLKYPTMTVAGDGESPFMGATQGYPDIRAMMFSEAGPVFEQLHSGNPTWQRSSDLTLASEGDLMVVVWEEVWENGDDGQPLDIGNRMNLVFAVSEDRGTTWSVADHLLTGDTNSHGGDPSVCIDDGVMYVAYHKDMQDHGSDVMVARRLPGQARFELVDVGATKPGAIGRGWLPSVDCNSGRLVVAWEQTDTKYHDKFTHRLGVAHIDSAATAASISYTPLGDNDITVEQSYELAMSVTLSEDGQKVDVFWVDIWDDLTGTPTAFTATLFHRGESFNDPACASGTQQ